MTNTKNFDELTFNSRKNKRAHTLVHKAIKILGNLTQAAQAINVQVSYMSSIARGRKRLNRGQIEREQVFLSAEKAIALSKAVDYVIKAEDLVPGHDFSYMYEYVNNINKR
jgi:hypothetical protein